MSALITNVTVDSAADRATIEIQRRYSTRLGEWTDLPEDMRAALLEWAGFREALIDAWERGKHQHYVEQKRQEEDSTYALFSDPASRNPHISEAGDPR